MEKNDRSKRKGKYLLPNMEGWEAHDGEVRCVLPNKLSESFERELAKTTRMNMVERWVVKKPINEHFLATQRLLVVGC